MSDIKFTLIDLGGASKPVIKLVDAVSDFIGTMYEPTRIRKKASADSDAAIIIAAGNAKTKEIEIRAAQRINSVEIRRQENIENIIKKAVYELPNSVSEKLVDNDWMYRFFECSQDVGSEHMQTLWSRLLAGEVSQPGTFSLRSLRIVRDLTSEEAHLFTRFCQFVWVNISLGTIHPVILHTDSDAPSPVAKKLVLTNSELLHLEALGLVQTRFMGFIMHGNAAENRNKLFAYNNKSHRIYRADKTSGGVTLGEACFTKAGKELFYISGANQDNEQYRIKTIKEWNKLGYKVREEELADDISISIVAPALGKSVIETSNS